MIGKNFRVKRAGEEKTNRSKREQNERVECGRDVYIENQENRFADKDARGERMGETTRTMRDNVFKGVGRTTPPGGRDTGCRPLLLRHGSSS